MKTLKQIVQEGELKYYIDEGALSEDAKIEVTANDAERLMKYVKEWLTQKRQEHKKLMELVRSPTIRDMHYWKAEEDKELLEELNQ